jgi:hypothetical protein
MKIDIFPSPGGNHSHHGHQINYLFFKPMPNLSKSMIQPYKLPSQIPLKPIPKDLINVLQDSTKFSVSPQNAIYIGDGAVNPLNRERYPFWLPAALLDSHLLIAGQIGSGKTYLLMRLIAGAIQQYGSVVISEAKAGAAGGAEGAAFTHLVQYLKRKNPQLKTYRWPRGNCYFNPCKYLNTPQDRQAFFDRLCHHLQTEGGIEGEQVAYLTNAARIANAILSLMQILSPPEKLTLRSLVNHLRQPDSVKGSVNIAIESLSQKMDSHIGAEQQRLQQKIGQIKFLDADLQRLNFYIYIREEKLIMTRHGINQFIGVFEHEDLLAYSESQPNLPELKIEDILFDRSLVVISQPLYDPASPVVGSLFWDCLLATAIQQGVNADRQSVLAVLDETHRLPVGRLGESGDFLREYRLGLVEVTPTIIDQERWLRNRHVYQTVISLTPGVSEVVELIRDRLPNIPPLPISNMTVNPTAQGQNYLSLDPNYRRNLGEDCPGVSTRSLRMTGRYTALVQSFALDGEGKVFWLDLESEAVRHLKELLATAIMANCPVETLAMLDRALGLV